MIMDVYITKGKYIISLCLSFFISFFFQKESGKTQFPFFLSFRLDSHVVKSLRVDLNPLKKKVTSS